MYGVIVHYQFQEVAKGQIMLEVNYFSKQSLIGVYSTPSTMPHSVLHLSVVLIFTPFSMVGERAGMLTTLWEGRSVRDAVESADIKCWCPSIESPLTSIVPANENSWYKTRWPKYHNLSVYLQNRLTAACNC